MRFLAIYTPDARTANVPPTPEHMEEMGKFMEEMENSGMLLATGGLLPAATGVCIRAADGGFTVRDGASATAQAAGFALLEAKSREEAIENCKRFLRVAGGGESELRQLMDAPPEAVARKER